MFISPMNSVSKQDPRFDYLLTYSDFHKDAYGVRPRYDYYSYTLEQLVSDYENFSKVCADNKREEELAQNANLEAFEARITSTIELGANDRKTALKWICEADEVDAWDIDFYLWKQGISSYDGAGKKLEAEILEAMQSKSK